MSSVLDTILKIASPDGRYIIHSLGDDWSVIDLQKREVVQSFECDCKASLGSLLLAADVPRRRAYWGKHDEGLKCYSLDDGQCLWTRPDIRVRGIEAINPRNGTLLVERGGYSELSYFTGLETHTFSCEHLCLALFHDELPITFYFDALPRDTNVPLWRRKHPIRLNILNETTFNVSHSDFQIGASINDIFCGYWKDILVFLDFDSILHGFNFRTGQECWNISLKERGLTVSEGGFNEALGLFVFLVDMSLLLVRPISGEIVSFRNTELSWGWMREATLVDNYTKLLLMDGRMFDVGTLELVEDRVFEKLGLAQIPQR